MTIGSQRRDHQLDLALATDDATKHPLDQRCGVGHRLLVDRHS
jgi:hypothetical protein